MPGTLEVLNVGLGDLRLTFDKDSAADRARARATIEDLLRKGYALMAEVAPNEYQRVEAFDPDRDAYVIREPGEAAPKRRGRPRGSKSKLPPAPIAEVETAGGRWYMPRSTTRATAVARSAGG